MDQPPPILNPQPAASQLPHMSLLARLLNVFAIPGEVFQDVRTAPRSFGNWLWPIVLATLVGAAIVTAIGKPALVEDFRQSQEKKYNEQVTAGKVSRADANQAIAALEWITQPTVLKTAGTLFYLGINVLRVLSWAAALWVLGTVFLKARFSFLKTLEIAGLATMISVLENVVTLFLTTGVGGTDVAMTLAQLEAKSRTPLRIIVANVFSLWLVGLMATGLARLAEVRFHRTFFAVLGYWITLQMLLALIGMALLALYK